MSRTPTAPENTNNNSTSSPPKFRRLHEITPEALDEWLAVRRQVGREKYGDKHLNRYGTVDAMEELLDALNILELLKDRAARSDVQVDEQAFRTLEWMVRQTIEHVITVDGTLPDSLCTDEEGGDRIWWPARG